MAKPASTKQKLLSLIEDVEIVSKELLEVLSIRRQQQKADDIDISQLVQLLVLKDEEIKKTLKIAEEQAELQLRLNALRAEVARRDGDIRQLQTSLKEAETVLGTAIYQAKQKLKSISQANNRKISSEELIKYAYKISASNAVAAPPAWAPGDHRRPYPTDVDMRCGMLGRLSDLPIGSAGLQPQGAYSDGITRPQADHLSQQQSHNTSSLSWQHSMEGSAHPGAPGYPGAMGHPNMDSKPKDSDDVEIMSSDSSSSSSSDE